MAHFPFKNRRVHGLLLAVSIVALGVFSNQAQAQLFIGPEAAATGGSGRAAVGLGESPFLNPAAVAFIQRYHMSAFYGAGKAVGEGDTTDWAVSIADGTSEGMMPGAFSYLRRRVDAPNGDSDTIQELHLALAWFPVQDVSLGLAGHGVSHQMLSATGVGTEYKFTNMNLGLIYVPLPNIGLGFVAYDVLASENLPVSIQPVPTMAFGFNYLYEKFFRFRLDLVRPDTRNESRKINVLTGLESFLSERFALRFGYSNMATAEQTFATAGFGYRGPRLSLDYSIQKDTRVADNTRHLIDLWLPL